MQAQLPHSTIRPETNPQSPIPSWRTLGFPGLFALTLVASGLMLERWIARPLPPEIWHVPATATDAGENITMATGPVSDDVEGVFFLDALSGRLVLSVFNPAATAFNSLFERNVAADLKLESMQQPRYLMVTGSLNAPQRSAQSIGGCIVYVLETTTSKFAAYGIPWRTDLFASGRPQVGSLVLLNVGLARQTVSTP